MLAMLFIDFEPPPEYVTCCLNVLAVKAPLLPFPPLGLLDPPLFGVRRPPGDRGFLFHRRLGELALNSFALFAEFGERLDSGAR